MVSPSFVQFLASIPFCIQPDHKPQTREAVAEKQRNVRERPVFEGPDHHNGAQEPQNP